MELKICISPQFRAIDPPNPARGFIQQNENVRFATAACMQKYGNVSFATVACAKCMRYGGRGGGTHTMGGGGGGWQHGTRHHIYIYIWMFPKIGRKTPQIIHFNRVFHYKPSILGYHYFWKHPYVYIYIPFSDSVSYSVHVFSLYNLLYTIKSLPKSVFPTLPTQLPKH